MGSGKRGGARPGGGRPKEATTRESRVVADKLAGLSRKTGKPLPLELMCRVMWKLWDDATLGEDGKERAEKDFNVEVLKQAAAIAKDAAPFIHPRLATQEVTGAGGGPLQFTGGVKVTVYLPENNRRKSAQP